MALPLDRERRTCWPGILNAGLTRCTWKKASLIAGVVTTSFAAALAAALGTSQAAPTSVPDAATLFRGGGAVSEAAMDAIKSKVEDSNVKVAAAPKKPKKPKPGGSVLRVSAGAVIGRMASGLLILVSRAAATGYKVNLDWWATVARPGLTRSGVGSMWQGQRTSNRAL